jgi:hypothetical protein
MRRYNFAGRLVSEVYWREGVQHGPTRTWHADGSPDTERSYLSGLRDGMWKFYGPGGAPAVGAYVQSWRREKPHGVWHFRDPGNQATRTFEFRDGVAIRANGQPIAVPLMTKWQAGKIDDLRIHRSLTAETMFDFVEVPLADVVAFQEQIHRIPLRLNRRGIEQHQGDTQRPITVSMRSIPLSVALVAISQPLGWSLDYRFGTITIGPAVPDGDPTGVQEVRPPPNSALATAWNQPVSMDFANQPLATVIASLQAQTGVRFDVSATAQVMPSKQPESRARPKLKLPAGVNFRDLSLRNSLGVLCEEYGLRLRQRGEVLVFEPQEP